MSISFVPPTSVPTTAPTPAAAPAAAPAPASLTGNPVLDAYLKNVGPGKEKKSFPPGLLPANINRNPAETADDNVNWTSWSPSWVLLELQSVNFTVSSTPGGSPYSIAKFYCHNNALDAAAVSETPIGNCEHFISASDPKRYGENMGDLATALVNCNFTDIDPATGFPLANVATGELVSVTQPHRGKFVLAHVDAYRGKKPVADSEKNRKKGKQSIGKFAHYTDVRFYPVDVVKNADGSIASVTAAPDKRKG